MQLYFAPGTCSLSPHIVAREAGIPVELLKVDLKTKKLADGGDFLAVSPKGYVPVLRVDDGEFLTEGTAIVQYLADRKPESGLIPKDGTLARYRVQEMLGFINSEIHKTYSPLFNPSITPEAREERVAYLRRRYAIVEKQLAGKDYLFGATFSVADAYLFAVTLWAKFTKVDLSEFPNVVAFVERVMARPAVTAAIEAEKAYRAKT